MQPYPGKKKKERNVRFSVHFPSAAPTLNLFRFQMKSWCYFSAGSPWACASPFFDGDFRGNHSTAAQPCLCKVTPPFHEVHVIYCSRQASFCMDIEGKSSELKPLWAPSQGNANTISAFPPSSSARRSFNTHTERQFCSFKPLSDAAMIS